MKALTTYSLSFLLDKFIGEILMLPELEQEDLMARKTQKMWTRRGRAKC